MTTALTPSDLLDLWDAGAPRHDIDRAVLMLAVFAPAVGGDDPAAAPLGVRDAALAGAFVRLFGEEAEAVDACPACGAEVEFAAPCRAIAAAGEAGGPRDALLSLDGGAAVRVRALDSRDLAAAARVGDRDEAERLLLERIVTAPDDEGDGAAGAALAEAERAAVSAWLETADPAADVRFDLTCPACATRWAAAFDIAAVLWARLAAEAERLLDDVDLLARRYGWSEPTILALSPARRARYVARGGRA